MQFFVFDLWARFHNFLDSGWFRAWQIVQTFPHLWGTYYVDLNVCLVVFLFVLMCYYLIDLYSTSLLYHTWYLSCLYIIKGRRYGEGNNIHRHTRCWQKIAGSRRVHYHRIQFINWLKTKFRLNITGTYDYDNWSRQMGWTPFEL